MEGIVPSAIFFDYAFGPPVVIRVQRRREVSSRFTSQLPATDAADRQS
jgi:hypothetical protein